MNIKKKKIIGLKSGSVELASYTKDWSKIYMIEEKKLTELLEDLILDIQHVGSTSIFGCFAKPIIDISIKVLNFDYIEIIKKRMEKNYIYKGDAGITGRHFFVKGNKNNRTHYIHIVPKGSRLWDNHIYFRDYLNEYSKYVNEYNNLKLQIVEKYSEDREGYSKAKSNFIESIIFESKKYYRNKNPI